MQLLASRSRIGKSILEYFRDPTTGAEKGKELRNAVERLARIGEDEEWTIVMSTVATALDNQQKLSSEVVASFLRLFEEYTKRYVELEFPRQAESLGPVAQSRTGRWMAAANEALAAEMAPAVDRRQWFARIKSIVQHTPGLYITQIKDRLERQAGRPLQYTTVRAYVEALSELGALHTIGGPQGRLRFCFPELPRLHDRSRLRGQPYLVDGKVKQDLSGRFKDLSVESFKAVYLVNSTIRPILLAVPRSVPLAVSSPVRAFGKLVRLSNRKELGVKPIAGTEKLPQDAVRAVKVASIEPDGSEKELWYDKKWASQLPVLQRDT